MDEKADRTFSITIHCEREEDAQIQLTCMDMYCLIWAIMIALRSARREGQDSISLDEISELIDEANIHHSLR